MRGIKTKRTKKEDIGKPPKWLVAALPSSQDPISLGIANSFLVRSDKELTKTDFNRFVSTIKKRGFRISHHLGFSSGTAEVSNGWVVIIDFLFANIKLYFEPNKYYGK